MDLQLKSSKNPGGDPDSTFHDAFGDFLPESYSRDIHASLLSSISSTASDGADRSDRRSEILQMGSKTVIQERSGRLSSSSECSI